MKIYLVTWCWCVIALHLKTLFYLKTFGVVWTFEVNLRNHAAFKDLWKIWLMLFCVVWLILIILLSVSNIKKVKKKNYWKYHYTCRNILQKTSGIAVLALHSRTQLSDYKPACYSNTTRQADPSTSSLRKITCSCNRILLKHCSHKALNSSLPGTIL